MYSNSEWDVSVKVDTPSSRMDLDIEDLKKLQAEGRKIVNVYINASPQGELKTFKETSKKVPRSKRFSFLGNKTVKERRNTAIKVNIESFDEVISKVAEFAELFGKCIDFYNNLSGIEVEEDLVFHPHYNYKDQPLKKPFSNVVYGNVSRLIFNDTSNRPVKYNSVEDFKKSQKGAVLPLKQKPKPVKMKPQMPSQVQSNGPRTVPLHKQLNITAGGIKSALDQYVIGQDEAKKALAAAAYHHYVRIYQEKDNVNIEKLDLLFYGPTASGKTYIIESLAKILDVPMVIADATSLTAPGYVGEDASEMINQLVLAAGGDREKAQTGIIYIDEIDKLASMGDHATVKTTQVQYNLLKLIEGKTVKTSKGPVDTRGILFVCGGAFAGDPSSNIPSLEELIIQRLSSEEKEGGKLGFGQESKVGSAPKINYETKRMQAIISDALKMYGLTTELVGRLKRKVGLNRLSVSELRDIITQSKNSALKQAEKIFRQEGIALSFEGSAIDYIAQRAYETGTGARELHAIIGLVTENLLFKVGGPENKITVTKEMVEQYTSK